VRVHQLASRAEVTAHAVRYYTRIGMLHPERDARNGYKSYSEADLRRVVFIRRAQSLGFELSEIAEIFDHSARKRSPCPLVREIIARHIRENDQELDELIALRERMRAALAKWRRMPDRIPRGGEICRLIEAT
jgi:DNA-binding transcriptional MerR regulator